MATKKKDSLKKVEKSESLSRGFLATPAAVHRWIVENGYKMPGKSQDISDRGVRNYCQNGDIPFTPDKGYSIAKVKEFCTTRLSKNGEPVTESSIKKSSDNERYIKARADKLELEIKHKSGQLVPLSDEIRRRVQVISGMKIAMENHRATFTQLLSEKLKRSAFLVEDDHSEIRIETINALVQESGHIYSEIVRRVFGEIGKQGGVPACNP